MNRETDSAGPNGNGILTYDLDSDGDDAAPEPSPKAKAQAKPKVKGAASLTADVVSRGRRRTQVYGEAGLWRGAGAPPVSEAPVRVAFPPVREPVPDLSAERYAEAERDAEREELAREALGQVETRETIEPPIPTHQPAERETDLATQVIGAMLVFAAVFVLGILLF